MLLLSLFTLFASLTLDNEQSLFFLGPSNKTPETRKWNDHARDWRRETGKAALVSRVSQLRRSTLACACNTLTKSEEKERLLAVNINICYAYHYLMMLIKWNLWILKGHNSFSYLWNFEPNTLNGFGEILFQKTRNFTENEWLIDFFATQQFRSFWWLLFPWKLHKLLNLISFFNICI